MSDSVRGSSADLAAPNPGEACTERDPRMKNFIEQRNLQQTKRLFPGSPFSQSLLTQRHPETQGVPRDTLRGVVPTLSVLEADRQTDR